MATAPIGQLFADVPSWTPYVAVAVSGLAGATYAARRGFDVVGVFGLAFATGLGGLMLRDLMLGDLTQNMLAEPWFLAVALGAALVGFFFAGLIARFDSVMVILDGLAMGFLCSIGAEAALLAGLNWSSAIMLGVLTAVGGLVLRDVLAGNAPEIVRPGVFITLPAILASTLFVAGVVNQLSPAVALVSAMVVSLFLRAGSFWFGWHTGSAANLSDNVWSFWVKKEQRVDSAGEPATYTEIVLAEDDPTEEQANGS